MQVYERSTSNAALCWRKRRCHLGLTSCSQTRWVTWLQFRKFVVHFLNRNDLDFDRKSIHVNRAADDRTREIRQPKTRNSVASVPMPSVLETRLRNYLKQHWRPNPTGLLFPNRKGTRPPKRQCRPLRLAAIAQELRHPNTACWPTCLSSRACDRACQCLRSNTGIAAADAARGRTPNPGESTRGDGERRNWYSSADWYSKKKLSFVFAVHLVGAVGIEPMPNKLTVRTAKSVCFSKVHLAISVGEYCD